MLKELVSTLHWPFLYYWVRYCFSIDKDFNPDFLVFRVLEVNLDLQRVICFLKQTSRSLSQTPLPI